MCAAVVALKPWVQSRASTPFHDSQDRVGQNGRTLASRQAPTNSMNAWIAFAQLILSVVAGALIGLERTYRGRAAGFRTYALVCLSSSMLMVATALPPHWLVAGARGMITGDPTRVVQGIMTGIGFLGAGVIIKEGFSVRGLTTAASIWVTAAIGILIGSGLLVPGAGATLLTVGLLSAFRPLEDRLPAQHYLHAQICIRKDTVLPESAVCELLREHGFHVTEMSYDKGGITDGFAYQAVIWTPRAQNIGALVSTLCNLPSVEKFRISPSKD
jgi:putative Mg2+ transporter-C (MgtC) family protein